MLKLDVSIAFILDNVDQHNQERYPLSVYGDPVVESDVDRVVDYITVWPCEHERITIKVNKQIIYISGNKYSGRKIQNFVKYLEILWHYAAI